METSQTGTLIMAQANPFIKFWELGYKRLVPIVPPDAQVSPHSTLAKRLGSRGKAVGIMGDDGLWRGYDWLNAPATTPADIARWHAMGAGVGIRTGEGLIALDIDSLDEIIAEHAEALADEILGKSCIRFGKWPKRLIVFRTTAPTHYQRVEFTGHQGKNERIEILSDGRQFVAHGIHPGTQKPYAWNPDVLPASSLPAVTPEQVSAYMSALALRLPAATKVELSAANDRSAIDQSALTGDSQTVAKAVRALPNTSDLFPTYDDYIRVGAAIKGATQDDPQTGEALFIEWASKWEGGNDPEAAAADYRRIKAPFELGARWLYDAADRYSKGAFNAAELYFQPIPEDTNPFAAVEAAEALQAANSNKRRLTLTPLTTAAEEAISASNAPLIKGFLDLNAFSVLYGRSNVGKTFVAMDVAFHIATGLSWGGMRTTKRPVVYVAAEGGNGAKKRAAALRLKFGTYAESAAFHFVLSGIDLFHPDADTDALIEAITAATANADGTGLVVIDTLARAMAGGDENSAMDMGVVVRNVDKIKARTGAHVMVVHHSGKDAARGARGSNALLGAVDTEIEVTDGLIQVTKQRDLDKNFATGFKLDVHTLGQDQDGDPVTSCTVTLCSSASARVEVGVATPSETAVLDAMRVLADMSPKPDAGVSLNEIVLYCGGRGVTEDYVRTAVKVLAKKNLVERKARGMYAPAVAAEEGKLSRPEALGVWE